jgi:hypothetical protein
MPHWPVKIGEISFCKWHECRGCESSNHVAERVSGQWLQDFKGNPTAMGQLRLLAGSLEFGQDICRMDDDAVLAQVRNSIERRGLRRCGKLLSAAEKPLSARDQTQLAAERVMRVLEVSNRPRAVDGQLFRIARAGQWRSLRDDGGYQIVPIAEARRVIAQLAAAPAATPAEKDAWTKADGLLSEQGRGRLDSGLLLLRVVPKRSFQSPSSEPPITPSQLARLVEKHWVAIELVDEDGNGVEGVRYSITAPDNQEYTGVTDASGFARVDNIPPGQCKISFPDLDQDAYKAA